MEKAVFLQLASTGQTIDEVAAEHTYELERLGAAGLITGVKLVAENDPDGFVTACQGYQIVLCGGNPPMSRAVVEQLRDSSVFIRYGVGVNTIDLAACTEFGKLVYYMPGYCKKELALHATALILSLLRNIAFYDRGMRAGGFPKAGGPLPRRLENLTVGLYGLGDSARELAFILSHGFHGHVIACDPYIPLDVAIHAEADLVEFDTLLTKSDILSIHAPLTPETKHIFDSGAFAKMKPGAMLINVSRGALVDTEALVDALASGKLGAAGLDVFEREPLPFDCPLLAMDNVILTPHSAFYGQESTQEQYQMAADFVEALVCQKRIFPRYIANKAVLSRWTESGYLTILP